MIRQRHTLGAVSLISMLQFCLTCEIIKTILDKRGVPPGVLSIQACKREFRIDATNKVLIVDSHYWSLKICFKDELLQSG